MTRYYKATRLDGTDFRTGTVLYEVGKRTTHPTSTKRTKNEPSTYLSVSTVPTDCTGFRWPCRLFAVEGVGKPVKAANLSNKRCFLAVDVVEELPAWQAFGPQGEQVASLIDRAGRLTADEANSLYAAWAAAWEAAWFAARAAARAAAWDAAWPAAREAARPAAWDPAWPAARDAAWALIVRDLITPDQFDTLTRPWVQVINPTWRWL